jgi:predicted dehydrogenase
VCSAGVENGGDHYEPTMQVLEAGKHTLTEKPISNNIEHAREMVAKAKRKASSSASTEPSFHAGRRAIEEVANRWRVGRSVIHQHGAVDQQPERKLAVVHIRALHPHSIDVMRFFGGDIKRVQCFMHKGRGRNIWSNLSMNVQFTAALSATSRVLTMLDESPD